MESPSKLKSLFNDASALPAADRDAFLQAHCANDPSLRARLKALLGAHDEAGEYLAQPTLGSATLHGLGGEGPGNTIGPYKLLEIIGEGGFGVVYMAEQREPVRRRVALKVIKPGMDSKQVIARFEQERQALAMMDHPNIAKVLDGGATQSGRPYFVMELVRGDPITTFADAQNLSIPQRLELFQQVCHAVQHAHQKGIIHRDLKPSNILVAEIDGRPTPRIIDFGIAKATGGAGVQLTDKTVFTEFRQFIGTPEYMSPEQAGIDAADIDTRSDIYSLGVLLYALLTGGPPFDPKHLRSATWEEMRRIIREDEPQRPSTRLHTLEDTREVAAHRQTEPARLIGLVRGDLDWIVMKCLEKDRARRYETANGLAMDVARHLSGEPVTAAPPSTAYRIRKFAHRHRAQAIAGSLIAASLLAAVAGTTTFAVREAHQRTLADRIARFQGEMLKDVRAPLMGVRLRDDVIAEAELGWGRLVPALSRDAIADRRKDLESLLADTNFTNAMTRSLDRAIFERALATLDKEFRDEPLTKAKVLQDLADTLRGLSILERARQAQEEALRIRLRLLGKNHLDTLTSQAAMAQLLWEQGKWQEAVPFAREAAAGRIDRLGEDDPRTWQAMQTLVRVLRRVNLHDEAEAVIRNLYDKQSRALGEGDWRTLESRFLLGDVIWHREDDRFNEAAAEIEASAEGLRRVLPETHPAALLATGTLGIIRIWQGRHAEADEILSRVEPLLHRELGDDNWFTWYVAAHYGDLLRMEGRIAEAAPRIEGSCRAFRSIRNNPEQDLFVLQAMGDLARLRLAQDRFDEAEACAREAIAGWERFGSKGYGANRQEELRLALVRDLSGNDDKIAEAADARRACVQWHENKYGRRDPRTLDTLSWAAWNLYASGRAAAAVDWARESAEGFRAVLKAPDERMLAPLANLATILRDSEGPETALPVYEEFKVVLLASSAGVNNKFKIDSWIRYAECLRMLGRFADAEAELAECDRVLAAAGHKRTPDAIIRALIKLYDAWDAAEPGGGYGEKAAGCRERLPFYPGQQETRVDPYEGG